MTERFSSHSEEFTSRRFTEMLNCVKNLHNLHICHHDLSLENVMLHQKKMIIVLIDLGEALKIPYNKEGRQCLICEKKLGRYAGGEPGLVL